VRLGSPRRPSSVGSPPFPGRTWRWWRRASKPAKAWAARGGDRWPSPVGADDPNNYQIIVELNVSTRGANPRNCGGVNRCRQTARLRATSLGRLEISLPPKGGSPCHSYASDASLQDVRIEHRDTRPMETQSEASAGAAQADRQQPVPPAPGATAFKRGRPWLCSIKRDKRRQNTVAATAGPADSARRPKETQPKKEELFFPYQNSGE